MCVLHFLILLDVLDFCFNQTCRIGHLLRNWLKLLLVKFFFGSMQFFHLVMAKSILPHVNVLIFHTASLWKYLDTIDAKEIHGIWLVLVSLYIFGLWWSPLDHEVPWMKTWQSESFHILSLCLVHNIWKWWAFLATSWGNCFVLHAQIWCTMIYISLSNLGVTVPLPLEVF